jgi:hypothetical protein
MKCAFNSGVPNPPLAGAKGVDRGKSAVEVQCKCSLSAVEMHYCYDDIVIILPLYQLLCSEGLKVLIPKIATRSFRDRFQNPTRVGRA